MLWVKKLYLYFETNQGLELKDVKSSIIKLLKLSGMTGFIIEKKHVHDGEAFRELIEVKVIGTDKSIHTASCIQRLCNLLTMLEQYEPSQFMEIACFRENALTTLWKASQSNTKSYFFET